jgi:signal transduction histidine kinase/CheY-like chemotaxis protein
MRRINPTQWGLTSKIVAAILLVSIPVWWVLDTVQSQQLRDLFIAKEYQRLDETSVDDRNLFDQYAQAIYRSVKLIVGQKRFVDFIESMPPQEQASRVEMVHQSQLPVWMPRPSLMRTFYRSRYALLYDQNNSLRAAYHHGPKHKGAESLPPQLLSSSNILRKLSHNQAYMTMVGGAPYLIASDRIRAGNGYVTLALVTPMDSRFLQEVVSSQTHNTFIALLDRDSQIVVASSDGGHIAEGARLAELEKEFLMAGKSFFDYGASDLNLQLSSFTPKSAVEETVGNLVAESRFQRAVLVAVVLTIIMFIMLLFVRRVLKVSSTVNYYSKHILGRDLDGATGGDELQVLGKQVDTLGSEVVSLRNELRLEVQKARRIAADLEARSDSLTRTNEQLANEVEERKRSEAERAQLHKLLQNAQRMDAIGQITGGVAHDFNNILAAILGFTDLIEAKFARSAEGASLANYLEKIKEAGGRGRDLVSSMLAFSRGEAGERKVLTLESEIHGVIAMLRPTISRSIDIRTVVRDKGLMIDFDPIRLQQVVMNLVVNARDSLEQGKGTIERSLGRACFDESRCNSCHAQVTGDYIELSIRDSGKGIAAENLANIFEPFFSTKEVGEGSGMGLSVIHGIMHANHGHILVESQPGEGTWFRLLFPPATQNGATQQNGTAAAAGTDSATRDRPQRILVVDDEIALTSYLKELLELEGYQVEALNDPVVALAQLHDTPHAFDLVISDQNMPQLTGIEMIREVRQFNPELPIIMCTGYSATTSESEALESGVDAFLTKPVNSKQLLKVVASLLREKTAGRDAEEGSHQ